MELNLGTSIELARRSQAGKASTFASFRCAAFHPSEPYLFLAVEDEIYMTDAMQGQVMARFAISSGQAVKLFPSRTEPLLGALVVLNEEYVVYVWNLHQKVIKAVYPVKTTTKKPTTWGVCDAKLYFVQQGSKTIYSLDWKDGSIKKLEQPKPVTTLHAHPFKPILGLIHSDGSIRLLNVITNSATAWNEGLHAAQDKPVLLAFHPAQAYLVALLTSGTLICWDTASSEPLLGSIKVTSTVQETVENVFFHGTLPFLLTLNNNGAITTWNFFAKKNNWIVKIVDGMGRWEISPAHMELATRYSHLPNFSTRFANDLVMLTEMASHPSYNCFWFNLRIVGKTTTDVLLQQHLADSIRIGVYGIHLFDERVCHMVVPQQQTLWFWASPTKETRLKAKQSVASTNDRFPPKGANPLASSAGNLGLTPRGGPASEELKETVNLFHFSNETFLLDDLNLLAYSPAYNDVSLAKTLPAVDFEGRLLRPTRVVRSTAMDRFLVFFLRQDPVKELTTFGLAVVCRDTPNKDITISPASGQSGIFFGSEDEFLVLDESGTKVEIWKNEEETTLPMVHDLPSPMAEVFWTPLESANIMWFVDLQRCRIIASFKNYLSGSTFMLNSQCTLPLYPGEEVAQIVWHETDHETPPLAGIVTSRRVLIVNERLQIIASTQEVASSCIWLGAALLFNTKSHIQYLTVRNAVHPLISLRLPDAVLITLLNDRVALAVRRAGETTVLTMAVGLLEPLVIGFLHYFEAGLDDLDRKGRTQILLDCAESYDARRISWQLVEEVTKHGYREFALQILLANPHLLTGHHQFAFELALTTHHYSTAFSLIERSTMLKTGSNLFRLQRAALKLGQFDVARKCAEATCDWTTLIYLYSLAKNKEGLLIMKKTLERDRDMNAGILALLERQLQRPEIAALQVKPDTVPIGASITPLATSEAQKLLARQDSRLLAKLSAKNFHYTAHPILKNMSYAANKRWKVENHAQVQCEMRTLLLEGGSGNLVVGPLLLNTLLGDWFTRQVPYFELPGPLKGDAAQRDVVLKLLASRQVDTERGRKGRTLTIGGGLAPAAPTAGASATGTTVPIPTLSLAGVAAANAKSGAATPSTSSAAPTPSSFTARGSVGSSSANSSFPPQAQGGLDATRSPRKGPAVGSTLRPMTAAAANLMNAIANSGTKSTEASPSQGLSEESSSPTDSDTLSKSRDGTVSSGSNDTTQILALAEQALTTDPLVLFTGAIAKLEKADFDGCILDLNAVLLSLLASNSQAGSIPASDSFLRQQVKLCARYKLICILLHRIRLLDEVGIKSAQVAHLTQFLADINVMPRHRLVLLRMAAKKNHIVQNFGFMAKCLEMLIPKALPDQAALEKQLEECKTKNLRDTEPLPEGTRLCVKSFANRWIQPKHSCVVCTLCNATYHSNMISLASPCALCFWRGSLVSVAALSEVDKTKPDKLPTPEPLVVPTSLTP
jgi:hypothetical protein